MSSRIIFAGTPDFSVPALQALIDSKYQVVGVYTQPDRPSGRGQNLTASPIKQLALKHNLTVFQPENFKQADDLKQLAELKADLMVVVAYGLLLPPEILVTPTFGCINIHASLLPRWRGAAPIQRAILAADANSGITIMQMDKGLDTGDMLFKITTPLNKNTTGGELHDQLSNQGAKALIEILPAVFKQTIQAEKQNNELACYAKKLTKKEALLDWSLSAKELHYQVCAFNPWPVSHTLLKNKKVRIWRTHYSTQSTTQKAGTVLSCNQAGIEVATGQGILMIDELQLAGKKRVSSTDFSHGRDITNEIFT